MRFLVNGRSLVQGTITGVQRYAQCIVSAMRSISAPMDVAIPDTSRTLCQHYWEKVRLSRLARGYDALFCPANMVPWKLDGGTRLVATVHCLRFMKYPDSYSRAFRAYYRIMIPRVFEQADAIVTVSEAARAEMADAFPQAARRIHAVPLGVGEAFRSWAVRHPERAILFVGSLTPAKNLSMLLEAMRLLADHLPHKIWIVGASEGALRRDHRVADALGRLEPERVKVFGQINDETELANIYARAAMLVLPTRYESFGLPALEAMAAGLPVIASDIASLREVVGDAGLLFDLEQGPESLADCIRHIACDSKVQQDLEVAGRQRSAQFTWLRCAERTLEIMESVC
jgi:glycosyltransferase involved in cell wall biosynthesis